MGAFLQGVVAQPEGVHAPSCRIEDLGAALEQFELIRGDLAAAREATPLPAS